MAEAMAEQLAAAHAEIKRLRAVIAMPDERDHTIAQLRQEVQALSQTVGLQAQTLREREAALAAAVRVPAAGRIRPGRRETSGPTCASERGGEAASGVGRASGRGGGGSGGERAA